MTSRGLTLIETVVSVVVVSLLFAAALNASGVAAATRAVTDGRRQGEELCQALMAEVLSKPYYDPQTGANGLGPGFGEANGTDRTGFDDVDDFNGWTASPPVDRSGITIPNTTGLTRSVIVEKLSRSTGTDLFTNAGEVKAVRVQVKRNSKLLYELDAVRSPAWDTREGN
jgi:MSHA pilin protein MshD